MDGCWYIRVLHMTYMNWMCILIYTYIYIYIIYILYIYILNILYIYIYPQTRVSSFPGLISVARVNENYWYHQSAQSTRCWALPKCLWCGERTKNILFSSVFSRVLKEQTQSVYIHRNVFCPSQDSSVWLGLTSRELLMSQEC